MFSIKNFFGDQYAKTLRKEEGTVSAINDFEQKLELLSIDALQEKAKEFKERLSKDIALDTLLPEAFAVVREASKRTLGLRHFDVQMLGGIMLHYGNIAEMRTGEGKTLAATLPAYLNALSGKGVHIVTVNDYLAQRDAVWMGQIYAFLGLSVGVINSEVSFLYDPSHTEADETRDEQGFFKIENEFLRPCTRKEAYDADITYGTNNEFGFDYLRDNIEYEKKNLRQRDFHYAIVDEIDSILIDEARTPLIISAPSAESENLYVTFSRIASQLKKEEHYTVDEKMKAIQLTDDGIDKAQGILGIENIYTEHGIKYVHHLETAVRAKALFTNDKEYVVRDKEIVIVDEFTGRLQPGRRWSEGLHQAIEAKENVPIQREQRTFASITFQNYFRLYTKLAGMTGTAITSSEEFYKVYGLETIPIPTNVEVIRLDRDDLIFQTEKGKMAAVAKKLKELHEKGQPVLIGTASIEKNELLGAYLKREGTPHEMLNAKNHEREGEIIAQAGKKGKVTIATNMAGRGVDIKLGGKLATKEEYEEIKSLGGLFVLGTERHEARRIDNQLRGRSGRQGDPGETQFFVSLEDNLMRVFAADTIKNMMGRFGIPEDQPIENRLITRSLESAQTKIEGFNFDARKHILSFDDVLNTQRQTVYNRRRTVLLGLDDDIDRMLEEVITEDNALEKIIVEKKEDLGEEYYEVVRRMLLQTNDLLWLEHLEAMNYLRSSVNLRAYGQRDPLIEYRKEGLLLFKEMEEMYITQITQLLPNLQSGAFVREKEQTKLSEIHKRAQTIGNAGTNNLAVTTGSTKSGQKKIGRNELVTITNGKEEQTLKYKKALSLLESGEWQLVHGK